VKAVRGRVQRVLDACVRGGARDCRALAGGARRGLSGRQDGCGLATAGDSRVQEVIAKCAADVEMTVEIAGRTSVAVVGPDAGQIARGSAFTSPT